MEFETILNPSQEVFNQIVKWTGETEDWAFQLNDYNFWATAFDQFWLYTTVEKGTNNLVASVSLARWDHPKDGPLYSLGMYYCVPKYRGHGLPNALFKKVREIIGDDNGTLTGVVKMSDKYAKVYGFDKVAPFWHISSTIKMEDLVIPVIDSTEFVVKNWSDVENESLYKFDLSICPRDRKKIMTQWFQLSETFTKVVSDKNGNILGYATIRIVSKNRLSVAPFYAKTLESAEVLLAALLNNIPNLRSYGSIGFLYPEVNKDAARLVERFSIDNKATSVPFIKSQFTKVFIDTPHEMVYSMSDCAHQFV